MKKELWEGKRKYLLMGGTLFLSYIALNLFFGRYELPAYDIYSYISFSKHYANHWFSTRAPEVAHGLELVSYPPLVFYLMALISFLPFLTHIHASILLISLGATLFSFSFYFLFRTLTGFEAKKALLVVPFIAFSPGLLKFVLVHGQLPLVLGLSSGFAATSFFYRILQGKQEGVYLTVSLALTAYLHHFSFLIMALMIVILAILNLEKLIERIDYLLPIALVSGFLALIGLYPMIEEMLFGISQGRIFHGSRNPLQSISLFHQFITTTYGVSILGIVLLFRNRLKSLNYNFLTLGFMLLGLGLVTPVPEILFGGFSDFIVYDRFSLVSSLFLTALIAAYSIDLSNRSKPDRVPLTEIILASFILLGLGTTLFANQIHYGSPTGYGDYNENWTERAVQFLQHNASEEYLYATRGYGVPVAELRTRTDIPTIDTSYFPGRNIPLLQSYGKVDRVPDSKFREVLHHADNLSLKYVLTFGNRSVPVLESEGWEGRKLGKGVIAWINPGGVPEYDGEPGKKRILFGLMPLAVLLLGIVTLTSSRVREGGDKLLHSLGERSKIVSRIVIERGHYLVFLLPLVAAAPAFLSHGLYPSGIDTPAHIFKADLIGSMLSQHGHIFRWTNQWYNGYPFMAIYPPLGIYALAAFNLLFQDITLSYNILRLFALLGLSAAVYSLTRRIFERREVSIFAVTLTVFSYPLYNNLFTVGRLATALGLPIYILLIQILLRKDIFQKEISRGHLLLGGGSALLFLIHSMLAYMFIYTGLIFLFVYRDRVKGLGIKPIVTTLAIPLVLSSTYLYRLWAYSGLTNPEWPVVTKPFDIASHVTREFTNSLPHYTGIVPVVFGIFAVSRYHRMRERFLQFSILNSVFFYILFWMRNYQDTLIPLFHRFDQARFEILFTLFFILVASYGFRYLVDKWLGDIDVSRKRIFILIVLIIAIADTAPMLIQSSSWSLAFSDEIDDVPVNTSYRAMGAGMRQWDSYILPKNNISNVFGWFHQGNPNPLFTKALQNTGGRWFTANFPQEIEIEGPEFRKRLMEISNTKYVFAATGDWISPRKKQQVIGSLPISEASNEALYDSLASDSEFTKIHSSKNLEVYRLEREMFYCEGIEPVWIKKNYPQRASNILLQGSTYSRFPVKGSPNTVEGDRADISCSKTDPYTISINVSEPGWLLVKESYYPYWEREDRGEIYNGFGFMVLHVNESTRLNYRPPAPLELVRNWLSSRSKLRHLWSSDDSSISAGTEHPSTLRSSTMLVP